MPILHTINKPAHACQALFHARSTLMPGDTLLFIEDGVFTLIANSMTYKILTNLSEHHTIAGLLPDIHARGLINRLPEWVTRVDYDGFVAFTETHTHTLSWT
ncbi:MAG: sulfurtransferase complex subunit TusB [Endozoicomonadaceae bacterium]|nr:sulfurtransferase complex subunit TusB [Endozoicomonadaceae bacterium]